MLVLTRKKHETIRIGADVAITVLAVEGEAVKIGISAPAHIIVHRQEVYDAIVRENTSARKIADPTLLHALQKNAKQLFPHKQ
jgi:carbon storage regulator